MDSDEVIYCKNHIKCNLYVIMYQEKIFVLGEEGSISLLVL